jgi:hypothetical protein
MKFDDFLEMVDTIFRCEEHLHKRLRLLVGWSVRRSVRPSRCNYVEN